MKLEVFKKEQYEIFRNYILALMITCEKHKTPATIELAQKIYDGRDVGKYGFNDFNFKIFQEFVLNNADFLNKQVIKRGFTNLMAILGKNVMPLFWNSPKIQSLLKDEWNKIK